MCASRFFVHFVFLSCWVRVGADSRSLRQIFEFVEIESTLAYSKGDAPVCYQKRCCRRRASTRCFGPQRLFIPPSTRRGYCVESSARSPLPSSLVWHAWFSPTRLRRQRSDFGNLKSPNRADSFFQNHRTRTRARSSPICVEQEHSRFPIFRQRERACVNDSIITVRGRRWRFFASITYVTQQSCRHRSVENSLRRN